MRKLLTLSLLLALSGVLAAACSDDEGCNELGAEACRSCCRQIQKAAAAQAEAEHRECVCDTLESAFCREECAGQVCENGEVPLQSLGCAICVSLLCSALEEGSDCVGEGCEELAACLDRCPSEAGG